MPHMPDLEDSVKKYAAALRKLFGNQKKFWNADTVRDAIANGISPETTIESFTQLTDDVDKLVIPAAVDAAEQGADDSVDEFGGTQNIGSFVQVATAATILNLATQGAKSLALILPFLSGKKSPEKIVRASIGLNRLQTSGMIRKYNKLAGVSGDKVAAREALRQIKEARIRRIGTYSQNEIVTAYTEGKDQHFKGLPGIKFKTWVTQDDEMVCPICGPLHLEEVPIYETFSDGQDRPIAHPNCRCFLRYRILK